MGINKQFFDIIGLTFEQVETQLRTEGYEIRVVSEDGKSFIRTADYMPYRANLTLVGGKVTRCYAG